MKSSQIDSKLNFAQFTLGSSTKAADMLLHRQNVYVQSKGFYSILELNFVPTLTVESVLQVRA